ncbi:DUF58 domain-containing protein [Mobiluncus mulieris]|uniref:DUF58 domain-containing protein n=1 Tax=Mobiluncus mulieris TaxID=2052 RepID=UPI0014707548|nr:DUF58 domain-containing protein [Mobiluncus mulieris]
MAVTSRLAILIALGIPLMFLTEWKAAGTSWLLLCLALWLFDALLAPSPRRLTITRQLPVSLRLNATTPYSITVSNPTRRRFRAWLRDAWQPSLQTAPARHRFVLAGKQTLELAATFTPTRKGTLVSDSVTIRSFGPLGLGARQFSAPIGQKVRVLPEFRSAKYLPSRLATLRRLEGNTLLTQRGQGSEFDSLREYVPGDDVRDIEWHVSARNRVPVVKTWRPERDRNVIICLDTSRTSAVRLGAYPRLDANMEAALLLGALASSAGDRIHLIAFDNRIRANIQPSRGQGLAGEMASTMAGLESSLTEANWMGLGQNLLATVRQRSLVVVLTGLEAGLDRGQLMPVVESLSGHHQVLVAAAMDPEVSELTVKADNTEEAFLASAAMADCEERRRAGDLLGLLGAQVLTTDPDALPPAVADAYLALKRRGQI